MNIEQNRERSMTRSQQEDLRIMDEIIERERALDMTCQNEIDYCDRNIYDGDMFETNDVVSLR